MTTPERIRAVIGLHTGEYPDTAELALGADDVRAMADMLEGLRRAGLSPTRCRVCGQLADAQTPDLCGWCA